ncbi:MAG: hypothetical protein RLY31_1507 [Bacteroidota bacterium]|jgi:hypothetical protein
MTSYPVLRGLGFTHDDSRSTHTTKKGLFKASANVADLLEPMVIRTKIYSIFLSVPRGIRATQVHGYGTADYGAPDSTMKRRPEAVPGGTGFPVGSAQEEGLWFGISQQAAWTQRRAKALNFVHRMGRRARFQDARALQTAPSNLKSTSMRQHFAFRAIRVAPEPVGGLR